MLAFILMIPNVFASFLDDSFELFRDVNFGQFYESYAPFIDGVLYFIIFFGLTKFVFTDKFKSGAKMLGIGVSLTLSFAAVFFSFRTGFVLGSLGPIAIIIVFLLLFFMLFTKMKAFGAGKWLAFSIGFLLVSTMAEPFIEPLLQNPTLRGMYRLVQAVATIMAIVGLFSWLKGLFKGGSGDASKTISQEKAEKDLKKDEEKEKKKEARSFLKIKDAENKIQDLIRAEQQLNKSLSLEGLKELEMYKKIHQELENYMQVMDSYLVPAMEKIKNMRAEISGLESRFGPGLSQEGYNNYLEQIEQGEKYIISVRDKIQEGLETMLPRLHYLQEKIHQKDKEERTAKRLERRLNMSDKMIDNINRNTIGGLLATLDKIKNVINKFSNTIQKWENIQKLILNRFIPTTKKKGRKKEEIEKMKQELNDYVQKLKKLPEVLSIYYNKADKMIDMLSVMNKELIHSKEELKKAVDKIHDINISEQKNIKEQEKKTKKLSTHIKDIFTEFKKELTISSANTIKEKLSKILKETNIIEHMLYDIEKLEAEMDKILENNKKIEAMRVIIEERLIKYEKAIIDFEETILQAIKTGDDNKKIAQNKNPEKFYEDFKKSIDELTNEPTNFESLNGPGS